MKRVHASWWLCLVLLSGVFALVGGCDAQTSSLTSTSNNNTTTTTGTGSNGSGGGGGQCIFCAGGNGGSGEGGNVINGVIDVSPASITLDVVDGAVVTQNYTATLNGSDVTAQVAWGTDSPGAAVMAGAVMTPTGHQGGNLKVVAKYGNAQGSALVTLNVRTTSNGAGLTPAEQAAFDTPSAPDPTLAVVYPYDDTVMPLRVVTPSFQWNGASAGDVYRVRFSAQHITHTEFIAISPPANFALTQKQWEDIQFSTEGPTSDPVTVEITRQSGGVTYEPKSLTLHIAQGFIYGAVYYWQLPDSCGGGNNNGEIRRIRADSPQSETFFNTPGCWGCHSVSRDGLQMMAAFDSGFPFPLQTIDLSTTPAQPGPIVQGMVGGTFSAYSPNGARIMVSNDGEGAKIQMVNAQNGVVTNPDLFGGQCGEPAWSPDGTKAAAVCGLNSYSWIFDATVGNLVLAGVSGDSLSGVSLLVPQAGAPGRPAYPSFSPDSNYVAYGRPTVGSRSTGNGTLWLVDTNTQAATRLDHASGDNRSYNPVFAPKAAGGYNWVVFISRRDYGNSMVGMNRQQLWVTAVDDPPGAGDPSHPPFYLAGQESCDLSENAYYALEPCRAEGSDCTHGIECCNKSCINGKCQPLVGGQCIPTNSGTCTADSDCCDFTGPGSTVGCIQGFCEARPPQ